MRKIFFYYSFSVVLIFIGGCKENMHHKKIEVKIYSGAIDTLGGLELAYSVNVSNNTNQEINFYTGLDESETSVRDGFYLTFKKLHKSYQMTSLIKNGLLIIPAQTVNKRFIIDVCFREYCENLKDLSLIASTYYKSANKSENIKNLMKDITVEYRINKKWNNKNYQSAFKNDSVISFNNLDTIDTKFYTAITGDTFKQMLGK